VSAVANSPAEVQRNDAVEALQICLKSIATEAEEFLSGPPPADPIDGWEKFQNATALLTRIRDAAKQMSGAYEAEAGS
jgi:hypothetical protein